MHLVHVRIPSLVLALSDEYDILRIWKVRRTYRPDPCVIRVDDIVATSHKKSSITDGQFVADGLSCWRLLNWTMERRPAAKPHAQYHAFERLFTGSLGDALIAVLHVYNGTWKKAPGEIGYFSAQQWRHHPREMLAIATAGAIGRAGIGI